MLGAASPNIEPRSPMVGARVLLVEDDALAARALREVLETRGCVVSVAEDRAQTRLALGNTQPDLVVLDLELPHDEDGLLLIDDIQLSAPGAPILICSGRGLQSDPTLGLRLGADDFIAKPFDVDELQARVEALLRRRIAPAATGSGGKNVVTVGSLRIEPDAVRAALGDRPLDLTASEFRLLLALARKANTVVPRRELLEVLGGDSHGGDNRLDAHASRLRAKLAQESPAAPTLLTLRGEGYLLASG